MLVKFNHTIENYPVKNAEYATHILVVADIDATHYTEYISLTDVHSGVEYEFDSLPRDERLLLDAAAEQERAERMADLWEEKKVAFEERQIEWAIESARERA